MAAYTVRVAGLSTADSPEHWVRLQFVGPGGRRDERYFRTADIVATPTRLYLLDSSDGPPHSSLRRQPRTSDKQRRLLRPREVFLLKLGTGSAR
jgi:hypothetical protein